MVTVEYKGRSGNRMFQYVIARIVAESNGMKLGTEWPEDGFIEVTKPEKGIEIKGIPIVIESLKYEDIHNIGYCRVHLNGYFQDANLFNPFRERIRGFFNLNEIEKNTEDVVMHVRLADYWCDRVRSVINPTWYVKIIKSIKYRNLYIVCERNETSRKYLREFDRFNPIYIHNTPREDFDFIRSFDKIICSNSSFCWWAAFLGYPKEVYTFGPRWMYSSGPKLSNLEGAHEVSGTFIRDRQLESLNWDDYWRKDPRTYCCIRKRR